MVSIYTYILSALTWITILFNSCSQSKVIVDQQIQGITVDSEDCYSKRKDQDTVTVITGVIDKLGDSFIIISEENNERLAPCNMPDACKSKGLTITCKAIKKEIFPNERWAATPSLLISISIIKE